MVRSPSSWAVPVAIAGITALAACNALTGAGDLAVGTCSGADCGGGGPGDDGSGGSSSSGASSSSSGGGGIDGGGADPGDGAPPEAPGGKLDTTFGAGGIALTGVGIDPFGIVVRSDGRIYVGGINNGETVVMRLTDTGALDAAFNGGKASTFGGLRASAITLGDAERPVVVGTALQSPDGQTVYDAPALARFNDDGKVDTGYGSALGPLRYDVRDRYTAALGTAAGVIVAGAFGEAGNPTRMGFWRFVGNGSNDNTFGGPNGQNVRVGSGNDGDVPAALATNGTSVVAAGTSNGKGMAVARVTATGAVDTAFAGGKALVTVGTASGEKATAVGITGAGVVVAGGEAPMSGAGVRTPLFGVARFTPAGELDPAFGTGGKTTLSFALPNVVYAQQGDFLRGLVLDAKGRAVVVGHSTEKVQGQNVVTRVVAARLTTAGALDPLFGDAGKLTFRFDPAQNDGTVAAAALDPAGRLVIVGRSNGKVALARITFQ